MLTANESVDDYCEVTPSQRASLEESDARWTEPPQGLIDAWNDCAIDRYGRHGGYNAATGFFELNGLTDITAGQARTIIADTFVLSRFPHPHAMEGSQARTNIPVLGLHGLDSRWNSLAAGCPGLEVFVIDNYNCPSCITDMFNGCPKLREVRGTIQSVYFNHVSQQARAFCGCSALESVRFDGLKYDLSLADSPLISLSSLEYMTDHAAATTPITITLHPNAYARLTDELIAQAAEKQITFATT